MYPFVLYSVRHEYEPMAMSDATEVLRTMVIPMYIRLLGFTSPPFGLWLIQMKVSCRISTVLHHLDVKHVRMADSAEYAAATTEGT